MRRLQFKFPSQIRISGWDFGSSARAMNQAGGKDSLMTYLRVIFTQAESGKCPGSTFERKTMSKALKRVALVAVTALVAGSFSAVSASAAPSAAYQNMYDTTNGYQIVGGQATVRVSVDTSTVTNIVVTGVGSVVSATAVSGSPVVSGTPTTGSFVITGASGGVGTADVVLTSAVTGTQTITMTPLGSNGAPGTAVTKSITWVTATSLDPTQSTSKSYLASGTTNGTADPTSTVYVDKGQSGAAAANVVIIVNDANGNPISGKAVTATVSGPGLIKATSGTTANTGTLRADSANTDAAGKVTVGITADGTAGVSTVTLTAGGVTFSKSVTFTGSASKYEATKLIGTYVVGANGTDGSTTAYAVKVKVTDSNGNIVADGKNVYAKSSDTTIATVTTSALTTASGYVYYAVTGVAKGKATISFCDTASCTSATVTTTVDVQVTSAEAAKVVATLDSSSYAPGEKMTLTITATDADGNPVADSLANTGDEFAWTTNLSTTSTLPVAAAFVGGKQEVTIYAPLSSGTFNIDLKLVSGTAWSTALDGTTVAITAGVSSSADAALDAANEATDAANAATDAANAAAEAADAATAAAQDAQAAVAELATKVASLIAGIKAQITTLTNLVIKIQKKVKA